jgi:hypothetical protein
MKRSKERTGSTGTTIQCALIVFLALIIVTMLIAPAFARDGYRGYRGQYYRGGHHDRYGGYYDGRGGYYGRRGLYYYPGNYYPYPVYAPPPVVVYPPPPPPGITIVFPLHF